MRAHTPYVLLTVVMLSPLAAAGAQSPQAVQPTPSQSQQGPSVASYLCTFAGKCAADADAPVPTRDAPETKGFRLARPAGSAAAATPASSVAQNDAASSSRASGRVARRAAARVRHSETMPSGALLAASTAATSASLIGRRADLMVGFGLDSAQLTSQGIASARIFAQSLQTPELSGKRFLIQGHTDLRGDRAHNMALSERRAQAVADFLVSQGVDRTRLETHGFGPDSPLPGHSSSDPVNRRVEAELLS